jgi:hypothetical protein
MEKLKKIVELLDGRGSILVRDAKPSGWFVNCHWNWNSDVQSEVSYEERVKKIIFREYVTDLDITLAKIIKKLEDKKNEK